MNWSPTGSPATTDDIIINCNTNPILDGDITVKSLSFDNTSDQSSTLNLNGYVLTVSNSVNLTDPFGSSGDQTINIGNGQLLADTLILSNTTSASEDLKITIGNGSLKVFDDLQMNGATTENLIEVTGTGKVVISGSINTGGLLDFGSNGIAEYDGAISQTIRSATYRHLQIKSNATKTLGGTTTVNGNLTVFNTATFSLSSSSLTVTGIAIIQGTLMDNDLNGTNTFSDSVAIESTGSWNISVGESFNLGKGLYVDGSFLSGTGTYSFSGSNITIGGVTPLTFSGTLLFSSVMNVTNNTNITLSSGSTLSGATATFINNDTLVISTNNFSLDSLIATTTGNAVIYNNASNVNAISTVYYYLEKQNTGILTIDSGITVLKHFEIDAGTVQCNYTIASNASATVIFRNGAALSLGATSSTREVLLPSNIPGANYIIARNFSISYNADGANGISNEVSYGNLTITTGTIDKTITLSKDLNVKGQLSLNNSTGTVLLEIGASTVDVDSSITGSGSISLTTGTLRVGLNYSNTGGFSAGSSTVSYDGSSNQSVKATTYYNMTTSGGGIKTPLGTLTITKDLTIGTGTVFSIANNTINAQGVMYINGTFLDNNTSGTNTLDSVIIESSGTWSCTVAENFTISGLLSNAGSFSSGTGTYIMAGHKTLSGDFVFEGNIQVNTGVTLQNTDSVWVNGNIVGFSPGTSVWVNLSNAYLSVGGTLLSTGTLTATATGNTVEYSGGSAQSIKVTTYYHLRKSGAGVLTGVSGITINGHITITSGELLFTSTITGTASSIMSVHSGGTLTLGQISSSTNVGFPSNIVMSNIQLNELSSVKFNTNGTQTFPENITYGGVSIATGTTAKTISLSGSITILGALELNQTSGTVSFDCGANRVSVGGNITGAGSLVFTSGTLRLGGSNNNHTGVYTPGDSLILNGSTQQTIKGGNYKHIYLDNVAGAVFASTITVTNSLVINSGSFIGGDNLTLVSNASGTARLIGPAGGGYLSGNVTVQRFIPGAGVKRYRSLSSPVQSMSLSQLIDDMHLTGPGGVVNGFDSSPTNWASLYTYREQTGGSGRGWQGCSNVSNTISQAQGFLLYVRGDRSVSTPYSTSSPSNDVTIDFVGTIYQGNVSSSLTYTNTGTPSDDGWNLVGNPYPCPIDWTALTKSNLSSFYYIYDPSTGSYVADNGTNTIASGQSFFVQANAASPVLNFRESAKTSTSPVSYFKSAVSGVKLLMRRDSFNSDFLRILPGGSNLYSSSEDATKLTNQVLNIYTRSHDSVPLQINACAPNLSNSDTISIYVEGPNGTYTLQLQEDQWPQVADILLYDKLANLTFNLRQNSCYTFSISNANNHIHNRFGLILRGGTTLPIDLLNLRGKLTTIKNECTSYELEWSALTGHHITDYTLSYATDASNWVDAKCITAAGNNLQTYKTCVRIEEPHNIAYFSVKARDISGEVYYSDVLVLDKKGIQSVSEILIYPNPVEDYCTIEASVDLIIPMLRIYDSMGVEVYTQSNVMSGYKVNLAHLKSGFYFIRHGKNHLSFIKK